jgi:hypothetical protein
MRDNGRVQHPSRPLAPGCAVLNSSELNDPEGPEKYNNTEKMYGNHTSKTTECYS